MYREPQQSVETSDTNFSDAEGDLFANSLIYSMPKSLSVRTGKTHVAMYPERSSYEVNTSNTIVFNWNSGNNYIDLENSFLKFKLIAKGVAAQSGVSFGTYGSALNLFREIRVKSKSGVELARDEQSNLYNNYRLQYNKPSNWIETIGSAFYLNSTASPFNAANTYQTEISIPLTELCTLFRPLKRQMLPPALSSGLRIELTFDKLATIFRDPSGFFGAGATLELGDISMMLSSVSLSDSIAKVVNLECASSGLEWTFERYHLSNSIVAPGTSSLNIQVTKAVSQATHVMAIISNNVNRNLATVDSFISEAWKMKNWIFRLGASYYPLQALVDSATNNLKGGSSFLLAMNSFDKMKQDSSKDTSVTLSEFSGSLGISAVSITRDESMYVAGQPCNSSRILEYLAERDATNDGTDRVEINVFMSYVSVARAFIDNVAVSI